MPTHFRITLVFKVVHLGRMWVVHLRANIDMWYRVNGKGIMHQPGVATQIMDWEDVLEKINAQVAG
jgi:hypothetical protein